MTTAKFCLWLYGHDRNIYTGEFSWKKMNIRSLLTNTILTIQWFTLQ